MHYGQIGVSGHAITDDADNDEAAPDAVWAPKSPTLSKTASAATVLGRCLNGYLKLSYVTALFFL